MVQVRKSESRAMEYYVAWLASCRNELGHVPRRLMMGRNWSVARDVVPGVVFRREREGMNLSSFVYIHYQLFITSHQQAAARLATDLTLSSSKLFTASQCQTLLLENIVICFSACCVVRIAQTVMNVKPSWNAHVTEHALSPRDQMPPDSTARHPPSKSQEVASQLSPACVLAHLLPRAGRAEEPVPQHPTRAQPSSHASPGWPESAGPGDSQQLAALRPVPM